LPSTVTSTLNHDPYCVGFGIYTSRFPTWAKRAPDPDSVWYEFPRLKSCAGKGSGPTVRSDYSRHFRSGILLISEIKITETRRVSRFRRPSLAVLGQSWAPLAFSLMAKNKECHSTARIGRTSGPVCRRVWPTPRDKRSVPQKASRIKMSRPPAFRPPPAHRRTCASSRKTACEAG
jgi:hypothetical protein